MKKVFCTLLIAVLAFAAMGCEGTKPNENEQIKPPISGELPDVDDDGTGNATPDSGNDETGSEAPDEGSEAVYYVVTFDSCGGSDIAPVSVLKGSLVEEPTAPKKSSKEGEYEFLGWFFEDKAWDFQTDTVSGNITLMAKWKAAETYTPPYLPKD